MDSSPPRSGSKVPILAGYAAGVLTGLAAWAWLGAGSQAVAFEESTRASLAASAPSDLPSNGAAAEDPAPKIASLRAEVARLEELLSARQEAVTVEPVVAPVSEPSAELLAAVDFLRHAFPALSNITAEEAAMLVELDARGLELTDVDMVHLAQLGHLRQLSLRGAEITDAGLIELRNMQQLEFLDLRGTLVTGLGLDQLPVESLHALHLTNTQVQGGDLFRLPWPPRLRTLKLNSLELRDDDLDALTGMVTLRHLELDGTSVTGAGIERLLQSLPQLTRIELRNTKVSAGALLRLKADYPDCEFVGSQPRFSRQLGG